MDLKRFQSPRPKKKKIQSSENFQSSDEPKISKFKCPSANELRSVTFSEWMSNSRNVQQTIDKVNSLCQLNQGSL